MRPLLRASLVNGRFGDPAPCIETLHQRGALHLSPPYEGEEERMLAEVAAAFQR
jgi:hypothetical protein